MTYMLGLILVDPGPFPIGTTLAAYAVPLAGIWACYQFNFVIAGYQPCSPKAQTAQIASLPVDIISDTQLSELTAGVRNAPKAETPKPLVDKVEEPKPIQNVEAIPAVVEKPEVKPIPKNAAPEQPPPEPKPEAKPEKAEVKPEPKPDPIAEAIKKEEARKAAEAKAKAKAKAEAAKKQPAFNPDQIAALLDKRKPQRQPVAGEEINQQPSLGAPSGRAVTLSISEIEALRQRLMQLWNPPAGVANPQDLLVKVRIRLGRDRKLVGQPQVLNSGASSAFEAARQSAIRALYEGQPYDMLKPENYELWKEMDITFDPREMMRG
jgi:colicin import membrane protein